MICLISTAFLVNSLSILVDSDIFVNLEGENKLKLDTYFISRGKLVIHKFCIYMEIIRNKILIITKISDLCTVTMYSTHNFNSFTKCRLDGFYIFGNELNQYLTLIEIFVHMFQLHFIQKLQGFRALI